MVRAVERHAKDDRNRIHVVHRLVLLGPGALVIVKLTGPDKTYRHPTLL